MDALEDASTRNGRAIVLGLAFANAVVLSVFAAIKYRHFLYDDFDLAIFHQAALQLLRGSFFTSIRGMAWPGDHSSLVLFLIAPLAAVIRHPLLLPVVQAVALSFGAVLVHRLARRELGSAAAAVMLAAAWLLQPSLGYLALFEFHPEALAVPALLLTWIALREGRGGLALAGATFALLCREDVALVVAALALFPAFDRSRRSFRLAAGLAALAALSLVISFAVLKPRFGAGVVEYGDLYRAWGPDTGSALRAMLSDPGRVLASLFGTPDHPFDTTLKRQWWLHLLLPWAALPVLAPVALIPALPVIAEHLLAGRRENHVIVFQYAALLLPFLATAAVHGIARGARTRGAAAARTDTRLATGLAIVAVIAAVGGQWMFGPFFGRGIAQAQRATQRILPDPSDRALASHRDSLIARIRGKDHLIVGFPFLPRISDRADVHTAHHVLGGRYTFSNAAYPQPRGIQAALLDLGAVATVNAIDVRTASRWDSVRTANDLRLTAAVGDLLLFERGATDTIAVVSSGDAQPDTSAAIRFGAAIDLLRAQLPVPAVRAGEGLPILTTWSPVRRDDALYQMDIVLADRSGTPVARRPHLLGYGLWAPSAWPAGTTERCSIVIPGNVPAGTYLVAFLLSMRTGSGGPALLAPEPPQPGNVVRVGTVEILPR